MKSLSEASRLIFRMLCQDCYILILGVAVNVIFFSWFSFREKEIGKALAQVKVDVSALQQVLPVATADRWSKRMMIAYNDQLKDFLNATAPFPNPEEISLQTPILKPQSPFIKASTSTTP